MKPIAYMHMPFATKFGIPRQSGLVQELHGEIIMEQPFSRPEAFRGLEQFSHIWLIWGFSDAALPEGKTWLPTVRPPRLGGNRRMGVFATRSPFRPNSIGLSCVKLEQFSQREGRIVLSVSGIDLMDGTPIYDIKPYIPIADCHPEATEGYTAETKQHVLQVRITPTLLAKLPASERDTVMAILAQDPRPGYSDDPERIYGIAYGEYDIRFMVNGDVLTVSEIAHA